MTVASADLELSDALVAVMVTVPETAGAVNCPVELMEPALADQLMELPSSCAVHCTDSLVAMMVSEHVVVAGDETGGDVGGDEEDMAMVGPPPQPLVAAKKPQNSIAARLALLNDINL